MATQATFETTQGKSRQRRRYRGKLEKEKWDSSKQDFCIPRERLKALRDSKGILDGRTRLKKRVESLCKCNHFAAQAIVPFDHSEDVVLKPHFCDAQFCKYCAVPLAHQHAHDIAIIIDHERKSDSRLIKVTFPIRRLKNEPYRRQVLRGRKCWNKMVSRSGSSVNPGWKRMVRDYHRKVEYPISEHGIVFHFEVIVAVSDDYKNLSPSRLKRIFKEMWVGATLDAGMLSYIVDVEEVTDDRHTACYHGKPAATGGKPGQISLSDLPLDQLADFIEALLNVKTVSCSRGWQKLLESLDPKPTSISSASGRVYSGNDIDRHAQLGARGSLTGRVANIWAKDSVRILLALKRDPRYAEHVEKIEPLIRKFLINHRRGDHKKRKFWSIGARYHGTFVDARDYIPGLLREAA